MAKVENLNVFVSGFHCKNSVLWNASQCPSLNNIFYHSYDKQTTYVQKLAQANPGEESWFCSMDHKVKWRKKYKNNKINIFQTKMVL